MRLGRRRPRLLLVNPSRQSRYNWDLLEMCSAMGKRTATHPLALPLLAALTPPHWRVRIVDEEIAPLRPVRFGRPDVVGITTLVSNAQRAFELAARFRAQGIPVVLGGPHVTTNVAEALEHADAVVVGEAESVWARCLADAEAGRLGRRYEAAEWTTFRHSPIPRWDLVDTSKILTCGVQVSRGCPNQCDFCLVRTLVGRKQRYREIDDVIAEIRAVPVGQIAFADDNLTANKRYARALFERLVPLKRSWSCQAGIDGALDRELVAWMAQSGCESVLIGFESLDPASLKEACKPHNPVERYEEAVSNLHQAGIHVAGSFVVGFDSDTLETFDRIYEFVHRANLSYVMLNTLYAYPGSDLHERLKAEGRLTPLVTELANGMVPVSTFKHMTQAELFAKLLATLERLYSYEDLAPRALRLFGSGSFARERIAPIGAGSKIRATVELVGRHLLSADPHARKLFVALFELVRRQRVNPGAIVPYLLMIRSVRGYLASVRRHARTIVERLEQNERSAPAEGAAEPSAGSRQASDLS
jgi:radical SAM superfamily enzyme YgiQ (UPF0313 family)